MPIVNNVRSRFQADKERTVQHRDLVVNELFLQACDAAFIEFTTHLPNTHDKEVSAAQFQQIVGAKEMLKCLLNIAEQLPVIKRQTLSSNLTPE